MKSELDRPRVVWLAGLVGASGCAALVYELVWFHLLQIVIGSSAWSLGILLGTFMGGLCLGSAFVPQVVQRNPKCPGYRVRPGSIRSRHSALNRHSASSHSCAGRNIRSCRKRPERTITPSCTS
jgi:hypothetical protein